MMMRWVYRSGVVLSLVVMPLFCEPSVYGFETEQPIQNRKISVRELSIQNHRKLTQLKEQLRLQQEKIEGLTSVIEGLSASLGMLETRTTTLQEEGGSTPLLEALSHRIETLEQNRLTQEQLDARLAKVCRPSVATEAQRASTPHTASVEPATTSVVEHDNTKETTLDGLDPATLYTQGKSAFAKKQYDKALKRFTLTAKKGYKPASSHYYLGEISYYTKQYTKAVSYFQKSAKLYANASYIDVLLLHTGISLERTGESEKAKIFYQTLLDAHGDKHSATIARKHLKSLEETR